VDSRSLLKMPGRGDELWSEPRGHQKRQPSGGFLPLVPTQTSEVCVQPLLAGYMQAIASFLDPWLNLLLC
jgi:hypothetical protein